MIINVPARGSVPAATLFAELTAKEGKKNSADQTIILVPGGPGGDHSIYKEQIDQLSNLVNVIVFDPRGCGESSVTSSKEYAMDIFIDDIEIIRQFFKLDRFILLGTSYGSMAAQGYAIKYGHRVLAGLILVAGAPSFEFIDMANATIDTFGGTIEQKEMFASLLAGQILSDDGLRDYFRVMAPLYTINAAAPEKDTAEHEEFHAAKKTVRYNYEAALAGFGPGGFLRTFDWRPQLSKIICPVRIVVGKEDWINNPQQALEIQKFTKDCKVEVIPDSYHFVWTDQNQQYFLIIRDFLLEILTLELKKKH